MGDARLNITSEQFDDRYFKLTVDILACINLAKTVADTLPDILSMIKKCTGFEAVGLRLRSGYDFPYYVTEGFPEYFVEAERHLCAYDQHGELVRNSQGNPYLECMCGNVICGRTNPELPFFTPFGSFWSNCTSDLLANTTEKDRQARTRNRCNGEGYESVALIPLRGKEETIGLLQLNDKRKDMFSAEMIQHLEGIGHAIGISFSQKQINDRLAEISHSQEERVRELNALYSISAVFNKHSDDLKQALGNIADIIPSAFGTPGSIHACLKYDKKTYRSQGFKETPCKIVHDLIINNKEMGKISLFFKPDVNDYMAKKCNLINIIYSHIVSFLEKYSAEQGLIKANATMEQKITERTQELTEKNKALEHTIKEKEMLIREIHHRIKNNLNMIQSLLNLQSYRIDDDKIRSIIDENQTRIQSISVIHDLLYKNSESRKVNMKEYINEIIDRIKLSFHSIIPNITFIADTYDGDIDIDTAIPCGIIINEMLTNSLKYAFTENSNGILSISFIHLEEDEYCVTIHDNGIGLPESIDPHKPDSFGMEIINALISQIKGVLSFSRDDGTTFSFTFHDKHKSS